MKNFYNLSKVKISIFIIFAFFLTQSVIANWQKPENENSASSGQTISQTQEKNDSLPRGVTDDWLNDLRDENGDRIIIKNNYETSRQIPEDPEGDAVQRKIFSGLEPGSLYGLCISSAGDVNNDGYDDIIIGAAGYSSGKGRAYIYYGGINMNTVPDVILTGETPNNSFGISVSKAGDVNGDGYSDVIVGARFYSNSTGRAYIFYGGTIMNNVVDVVMTGETINSLFGRSVSTAGDVNGDGYSDVIVGAYGFSSNKGRAYIYFGGTSMNNIADVIMNGETNLDYFGYYVSSAEDINADGYSDVIVGAYGYLSETGKTYVFLGGTSMNSVPDLTMTGEATNNFFGRSVSSAGDINGDGYSDIIIGAFGFLAYTGRAYIYYGGFLLDNNPDLVLTGAAAGNSFGVSVSTAGDVNGDGYTDVFAGASGLSNSSGASYLFFGGISMDSYTDVTVSGEQELSYFGNSVSTAGDVNGDGYSDLIVGAFGYSSNMGRVYLYDYYMRNVIISDVKMTGDTLNPSSFGISVSSAGDVNGDGFSDVIIGAFEFSSYVGRSYIYYGGNSMDNIPDITMTGEAVNNYFGFSVSSAGDVNGDGFSDVIVGAYGNLSGTGKSYLFYGGNSMDNIPDITMTGEALNNYFGISVSSAGDVNGDGFSDIIVGANGLNKTYIYQGGISMDNIPDVILTESYSEFGRSISSLEDIDGDGFSDVIVGAYGFDRVFLYLGGTLMDNIADFVFTSEIPSDEAFGFSVSTAGDINGDGYSEVIIGAHSNLNVGKAYIYFGGSLLDNIPDVILTGQSKNFGYSVSTAGDVNKDGYSDIIVGDFYYPSNNGRAYLFYGGYFMNNNNDVIMTGEGINNEFGISVSPAGDVNNDGYDDMIVGSPLYNNSSIGRAYIYEGSVISIKPSLIYAKDVPNDQGGKIKLKWAKCGLDIPGNNVITDYVVYISEPPGIEGFKWIQAADILATKFPFYYYIANTLNDSSSVSNGNNFFLIKARNSNTGEIWNSNIISGRSIDNIAPLIVSPFLAASSGTDIRLDWQRNTAPDLMNYVLFRSVNPTIDPYTETIWTTATDSTLLDTSPLTGSYNYFIVAQDIHGNYSPVAVAQSPSTTLNLTMFIEGFYNAGSNSQVNDSITVQLRNSTLPFAVAEEVKGVVASDGTVQLIFDNTSTGNYYVAVLHRNSIETWSDAPVPITFGSTNAYDFSIASSQAFGSNQIQVDAAPLRFGIYSGDVNQDGTIDVTDLSLIDGSYYGTGYIPTDVNGDGVVDISDSAIADNNSYNFVGKVTP